MKKIDQIQESINLISIDPKVQKFIELQSELEVEKKAIQEEVRSSKKDVKTKYFSFVSSEAYKKWFDISVVEEYLSSPDLDKVAKALVESTIIKSVDYEKLDSLCVYGALPLSLRSSAYREELISKVLTKKVC